MIEWLKMRDINYTKGLFGSNGRVDIFLLFKRKEISMNIQKARKGLLALMKIEGYTKNSYAKNAQ